ncbi:hypothetical protein EI94DRAFT_1009382 [Lactarius quietus]|nr:hypothetical protein EI94DRAFT_1009382 [Lactarius quietus]
MDHSVSSRYPLLSFFPAFIIILVCFDPRTHSRHPHNSPSFPRACHRSRLSSRRPFWQSQSLSSLLFRCIHPRYLFVSTNPPSWLIIDYLVARHWHRHCSRRSSRLSFDMEEDCIVLCLRAIFTSRMCINRRSCLSIIQATDIGYALVT